MDFEIFHDQGAGFISNLEPTEQDSVTLRLRAANKALTRAVIQYSADGSCWNEISMEQREQDATGYYEFWEGTIPAMQERYHYRFFAEGREKAAYFGAEGMSEEAPVLSDCFSLIPGMSTPDWAKGIIWYSLMPDSFCNGDILNDMAETKLKKTVPWGSTLQGLYEYYGGDIRGILSKIDYIKELGAEGIYVNPMWTSDSQAGYGPNNYYETSPNYGNEEDFATLCRSVHEHGMPIMIDAVFSYSQANSIFTNSNGHQPLPGAFESRDSAYSDMFRFEQWPVSYTRKWGGIENDLGSETARDLLWRREDSVLKRYLKPPYNVDGWRFDAINSYAGTDTSLTKIGAEIRRETKGVKPDVLLVGEDYSKNTGLSGNWDAMQSSFFIFTALLWFQRGQYDQSWLVDRLYKMAKLPRTECLCMYNNFENHDTKRILSDYAAEKYRMKGIWLLQMTFMGAPVIYYGAENGAGKIGNPTSRNSFIWNEAEWNFEIRTLCKTLCRLRKEYTALKDGAFRVGLADNRLQMTVYGRWDGNGTVVTMLNQQDHPQTLSLDLKQYNICDGTEVTDYLTGQTYTVEQGAALVTVPAGGSILVTKGAGAYRGRLELSDPEAGAGIVMPEENCYVLSEAWRDQTALTPIFGCGYIEADIRKEALGGALILQDGLGRQMTALFTQGGIAVYDLDGALLAETVLPETGRVRLGIGEDRRGMVAVLAGEDWGENGRRACRGGLEGRATDGILAISKHPFVRTGGIRAGIGLRGNTAVLSGVKIGWKQALLWEDFSGAHLGSLFSEEWGRCRYMLADKTLTMEACGAAALETEQGLAMEAEGPAMLLSEARSSDFTFKACLKDLEKGFAGVVSYCSPESGVAFVRDVGEEDRLVFGYLKGGKMIPYECVQGDFSRGVELQLQRVGGVYTAVYFQNGQARGFSSYLPANLSEAKAGILCKGGARAVFSYACFGNSICDKASVNTPATPDKGVEMALAAAVGTQASELEQYNIIGDSSQWQYALGGIERKEAKGLSQLAVTNRTYGDFRLQCTLLREKGSGTVGVTMLRSGVEENLGDGYILSLDGDNRVTVVYRGEVLFEKILPSVSDFGLKLNINRRKERLFVYAGADHELLACIPNVTVERGYVGFYFSEACGHINNYMILDTDSLWMEPLSPWAQNIREEGGALVAQNGQFIMASRKGAAYTNVRVSGRIVLDPVDSEERAYAGFLFGAAHDATPGMDGVLIGLEATGTIFISKKGKRMATALTEEKRTSVYLTITVEDGRFTVYLSDGEEPCLTWEDTQKDGGVVSLVSEHSKTGFYHVSVEDMTGRKQRAGKRNAVISRNGIVIENAAEYTETASGDVIYRIDPMLDDKESYCLELDFTVHEPASPACFPILYFRGNPWKKIGLYSDGEQTYLADQNRGVIADADAEATWVYGKQQADRGYHIRIESEPDSVTVEINGNVLYRRMQLSNCLSGDFSGLPILPEIVCVQGQGRTRTEIRNITLHGSPA